MVKRAFDIVIAATMLVLCLPLFLVNFLAGGRIRERRILGANGEALRVPFFERGLGFMKNIPRYFSVLAGRLSIVGSEIIDYKVDKFHPTYKPGLTGLVQVKSREKKQQLTQKEKDYYNLYYIKNQSIVTDLQIIVRSIF